MEIYSSMKFLVLFLSILFGYSGLARANDTSGLNAKIIPTPEVYSDFLIEPWKPNAPSVIVFKDPNCGYCIRALKALDKYKDYNVFMFWSPILGDYSDKRVAAIMECDDPISQEVFDDVITRTPIECKSSDALNPRHSRLQQLNKEIVQNYNPQSVPSYYFGGQKVYLSSLKKFKQQLTNGITPVKLDWARYEALRLKQSGNQGLANAILFVSDELSTSKSLIASLENDFRYNWHLAKSTCESKYCTKNEESNRSAELRLLMDVPEDAQIALVIDGMVIQTERLNQYLSNESINAINVL